MSERLRAFPPATIAALILAGVLGLVAMVLLVSDLGERGPRAAVSAEGEDNDEGSPDEEPVFDLSDMPEVTFDLVISRDPFDPVRPPPPTESGQGTQDGEESPPPANGDPSSPPPSNDDVEEGPEEPSTPPSGPGDPGNGQVPPPRPGQPCSPDGSDVDCEGQRVRVLDVDETAARIQVADVVYDPAIETRFAGVFAYLGSEEGCAVVSYDDRQVFRACPTSSTLK